MATTTMAIVTLIPGSLGHRMNQLRRGLDPDAVNSMPAHIPLVAPFQAQPSFLPLEQHCWRVCHDTVPLQMELGPLVMDESERPAYCETTTGRDELIALREVLLTGKYAPPRGDGDYQPRAIVGPVTFRDELALAKWEETATKFTLSFVLERIELMAQYPDGTWYERDFYTLDRAMTGV